MCCPPSMLPMSLYISMASLSQIHLNSAWQVSEWVWLAFTTPQLSESMLPETLNLMERQETKQLPQKCSLPSPKSPPEVLHLHLSISLGNTHISWSKGAPSTHVRL